MGTSVVVPSQFSDQRQDTLPSRVQADTARATTMNIYGNALMGSKRDASRKVLQMTLRTRQQIVKRVRICGEQNEKEPSLGSVLFWLWEFLGVFGSFFIPPVSRNLLNLMVAGVGFEPSSPVDNT